MHSKNMVISDFCITDDPVPLDVADKILKYHLRPLERVNEAEPDINAKTSVKSCYRPEWYEISKKRSGKSEHTFKKKSKGANDITCDDFENNSGVLLEALIENTGYTRFAKYSTFWHCDYREKEERWVFNSKWVKQYRV